MPSKRQRSWRRVRIAKLTHSIPVEEINWKVPRSGGLSVCSGKVHNVRFGELWENLMAVSQACLSACLSSSPKLSVT